MISILLVEDDPMIADSLKNLLSMNKYTLDVAYSFREAMEKDWSRYAFFIMDIRLPDGNGLDLCRNIRQCSKRPILFLTASDDEDSLVRGFKAGGDDYLTKPFRIRELLVRIEALNRRYDQEASGAFSPDGGKNRGNGQTLKTVFLDCAGETVSVDSQLLGLTPVEYRILEVLIRRGGNTVNREVLLGTVWDDGVQFAEDNTLSVFIRRIRKKLEDAGCEKAIETCWGKGYRWNWARTVVKREK